MSKLIEINKFRHRFLRMERIGGRRENNEGKERAEGRETLFARLRSVSSNQGGSKAGRNQFLRKKMSTGCSPSRGVLGSLLPLLPLLLFSSVGTRSPQSIAERESCEGWF